MGEETMPERITYCRAVKKPVTVDLTVCSNCGCVWQPILSFWGVSKGHHRIGQKCFYCGAVLRGSTRITERGPEIYKGVE